MFVVGDKVRCINSRSSCERWGYAPNGNFEQLPAPHLPGLAHLKKFTVTQTRDYSDGSQQIWVQHKKGQTFYGPYLSTRFETLTKGLPVYEYKPDQQGDTDEDI